MDTGFPSTPLADVNITDARVPMYLPEPQYMWPDMEFSVIFLKTRKKNMGIRTTKVLLKTGEETRGVKVTFRNAQDVSKWAGGKLWIYYKKDEVDHLFISFIDNMYGGRRMAFIGDTIVKFKKSEKEVMADKFMIIKQKEFSEKVKI